MKNPAKKLFIVAGEPSGDARGAELVREIKKLSPSVSLSGIGGDLMAKEGVRLIEHIKNFSIMGTIKILTSLFKIKEQFRRCIAEIKNERPDAVILIDYPGFNLTLARILKKEGIPVIYYIIPQVWAWGTGRVDILKKYTDKIFVIFDFEKKFLEKHGVDSEFIGHPLVDMPIPLSAVKNGVFTVAILPGSRKSEVRDTLPLVLDSVRLIKERSKKNFDFVLAENSNVDALFYDRILEKYPEIKVKRVKNDTLAALSESDFAFVNSGTATLETALMEKPMVVIYKFPPFARVMGFFILKTRYIALVNIISGREVVPEFVLEKPTPGKISEAALLIIENTGRMERMKNDLRKVKDALGENGGAKRAASSVLNFLGNIKR